MCLFFVDVQRSKTRFPKNFLANDDDSHLISFTILKKYRSFEQYEKIKSKKIH